MSSLVLQRHGSVHVMCGPLDAYAKLPRFQTTKLDGTPEAEEQTRQVRDVLVAADARNLSRTEVFELLEHAQGKELQFTLKIVPAEPVDSLDALVATQNWWSDVFVLSSWTKASIAALAELAPQCAVPAPRADAYSPDFPGFPVVATLSNDGVLVENTALNRAWCQVTSAGHGHLILFTMYSVRPLPADVDELLKAMCGTGNTIIDKKSESAGKKAFKALGFAPGRTLTADQLAHLETVYGAVRDLDDAFSGKHVFARKFELVLHAAAVARHLGGPDTFVAAVRELIASNNPLLVGSKGVREVVAAMQRYVTEEGLSFADCFAEAVAKGRVANAKRGTVAKGARAAAAEAAAAEAAAATRKRKERDERTAARGSGRAEAPARRRKKSNAAEKPAPASPPGQSSSEEEMSEEEAPAGEPAVGAATPARGAEEVAAAAAPALGGLDDFDVADDIADLVAGEGGGNAEEPGLFDEDPLELAAFVQRLTGGLPQTSHLVGYELAGPPTAEVMRVFAEGDFPQLLQLVNMQPPTAAELGDLQGGLLQDADALSFDSLSRFTAIPAVKSSLFIISQAMMAPERVHYSVVRWATRTLRDWQRAPETEEEAAEDAAFWQANEQLWAFCNDKYREAATGGERLGHQLELRLAKAGASRNLPVAWVRRLQAMAADCILRGRSIASTLGAAAFARDAEQMRAFRGGGTEDWAHFGQRSRRVLRNTVPEDAIFVLAGTWWFMALLKERKEPGTLERLFGESYEAAGPYAKSSDDEEADADSGEEEEEEESSDEED
jgi:hypothetical protein